MQNAAPLCRPAGRRNGPSAAAVGPLKFRTPDRFRQALRLRVAAYFAGSGRRPRDCPRMYAKSALILGGCLAAYAVLLTCAAAWWLALPLALLLGLGLSAAAFNVQHDGGHGAYSERPWVNRLAALTLDLLGGSSYVWARKHNSIHHSYTNISGHDDDIDVGWLGRLSPWQPRLRLHRFQHLYLWFFYGLLPIKWHLFDDFRDVLTGRIGGQRFPRPRGADLLIFLGGKALFLGLALGLPLLLHGWWWALAVYGCASFVQGLILSVVFQLAHCVEQADFPQPCPQSGRIEAHWAVHQVHTTVNFAPGNRLLTWFIGGLNYQIEHHLFPQICHVHYPALAPLVEQTCREFALPYKSSPSLAAGVRAHYRWLQRMGRPPA